jgi:hypothetical protein
MGYNFEKIKGKGRWGEGGESAGNVSKKGMVLVEAVTVWVCKDSQNLIHGAQTVCKDGWRREWGWRHLKDVVNGNTEGCKFCSVDGIASIVASGINSKGDGVH